ncbi:hypothetical protein BDZ91DRAFT_738965 [Kalaharituber pfeilii]|nr:hypothetical protein BDZ91DRAFT_738965 [Kalaharituber pfeilii]
MCRTLISFSLFVGVFILTSIRFFCLSLFFLSSFIFYFTLLLFFLLFLSGLFDLHDILLG